MDAQEVIRTSKNIKFKSAHLRREHINNPTNKTKDNFNDFQFKKWIPYDYHLSTERATIEKIKLALCSCGLCKEGDYNSLCSTSSKIDVALDQLKRGEK